jgi:hypothetical protein
MKLIEIFAQCGSRVRGEHSLTSGQKPSLRVFLFHATQSSLSSVEHGRHDAVAEVCLQSVENAASPSKSRPQAVDSPRFLAEVICSVALIKSD